MAVQAQQNHSNALLLNRGEQEMKGMDHAAAPPPPTTNRSVADKAAAFISINGAAMNQRKRSRESTAVSVSPSPTTVISLSQLHQQSKLAGAAALVSTGLRLAFDEEKSKESPATAAQPASFIDLSGDDAVAAQINQQRDEIDLLLRYQSEQLRRTLLERRQRHRRALLGAAEEAAAHRLREKEAELELAVRRGAELEDRIARLRSESMAWQAKAMAEQANAAALDAQLQQAVSKGGGGGGGEGNELPADDAESAQVDPRRVEERPRRSCKRCRAAAATVVALPCRHLSLCAGCAADAKCCPACRCRQTGTVQVERMRYM